MKVQVIKKLKHFHNLVYCKSKKILFNQKLNNNKFKDKDLLLYFLDLII